MLRKCRQSLVLVALAAAAAWYMFASGDTTELGWRTKTHNEASHKLVQRGVSPSSGDMDAHPASNQKTTDTMGLPAAAAAAAAAADAADAPPPPPPPPPGSKQHYKIHLSNRKSDELAAEAAASCQGACKYPLAGLAVTPPQEPFWFEGHSPETYPGGGRTQQLHPARAVWEIMQSGEQMSMMAVDIGAAGGSPEAGPLYSGKYGPKWGGALVDARSTFGPYPQTTKIQQKAEPPTIAKFLQEACMPADLDLLKIDIDCYDWDVVKALLEAGFRPKVFAAEITIGFPPPVHFHVSYHPGYNWVEIRERHRDQQVLVGASLSACASSLCLGPLRVSAALLTPLLLVCRLGPTETTGLHPPCCGLLQRRFRTDQVHPPVWRYTY